MPQAILRSDIAPIRGLAAGEIVAGANGESGGRFRLPITDTGSRPEIFTRILNDNPL